MWASGAQDTGSIPVGSEYGGYSLTVEQWVVVPLAWVQLPVATRLIKLLGVEQGSSEAKRAPMTATLGAVNATPGDEARAESESEEILPVATKSINSIL